jgi:Mg-chelatase subunit ChlD
MLMLGAAVDYGRAKTTKSRLQASVDAAALAAVAGQLKGGDPQRIAENYLNQQFAPNGQTVTTIATPDVNQGSVTVQASVGMPASLMRMAGFDTIAISAKATAAVGASGGGSTEVAIVFDATGSMAVGGKLTTARAAAKDLVDKLIKLPNGNPNPNVKVGLVPFTTHVNVGLQYRGASCLTNSTDYTTTDPQTCYNSYPNAVYGPPTLVPATCYADGVPYDCSWNDYPLISQGDPVQVCYTPTNNYTWYGCVGSQSSPSDENDIANAGNPAPALFNNSNCPSPLIRIGATQATLNTALDALTANGETYIPSGLLWGWRLLSPNPPFGDGASNGAAKKILILMTDGANTHSANYPDHEGTDAAAANAKLVKVCTAVKGAGIQLYAIAFQVTDATIQNILSQCATGVPYYYNAQTNADLQSAFTSIGQQLTNLRLVQ